MFNFACPVKLLFNRGARPKNTKISAPEPDPGEIGFALHGAGTGIGQKGAFFKGLSGLKIVTDDS
jgi:hypothetical protein